MLHKTKFEALYNTRSRFFRDAEGNLHWYDTLACETPVYNPDGWELAEGCQKGSRTDKDLNDVADDIERSARRARKRIFELMLCTYELTEFVTLTFDPKRVPDRADYNDLVKRFGRWLDNHVRRDGLSYIFVPERHKDGAVHFHGMINAGVLRTVDSGTVRVPGHPKPIKAATADRYHIPLDQRQTVFNLPQWKYGFSTLIHVDCDRAACCGYIAKYCTKQNKAGGRYYLHGGKVREFESEYFDTDFEQVSGDGFAVAGLRWKLEKADLFGGDVS